MRPISILLLAALGSACAPAVGAWRADGAAAGPGTEPRAGRFDDRGRDGGRLDDGEEIVGCLGQLAVIGGVAAVIYLTRFQGRGGGGGGDGPEARDGGAPEMARVAGEGSGPGAGHGSWTPGDVSADVPGDVSLSHEAAAIVEGTAFRPCGRMCRPAPAAP